MDKKKSIKIMNGYIFLCITILGAGYILFNGKGYENNKEAVYITFLINTIIIIYQLMKTTKIGYSINDMIWIFLLAFMVIAAILQYMNGLFPWPDSHVITDNIIISANIIILIFMIVYIITKRAINVKLTYYNSNLMAFNNVRTIMNIGFYISILCTIYVIWNVGFINLFSRSTNYITGIGSVGALIVENSFTAVPIITLSIHYIYRDINKKYYSKTKFFILLIMGVVINFPTGMPRFKMAMVYIGIFIVFKNKFKNKYIFKYLILFGLLFIFPVINIFRYNTFSDLSSFNIILPNPTEDFLKGDFDSFSMLCRNVFFITENGITWGNQLLGNILFFVPRSMWQAKPIGSGAFIGEWFGWSFTNVSLPFIGEGLINFGIIGVVIFASISSYVVTKIHYIYEIAIINENTKVTVVRILYPFIIGFAFFIMRGDLLSSFSFMLAFLTPCVLLWIVDRIISLVKNARFRGWI